MFSQATVASATRIPGEDADGVGAGLGGLAGLRNPGLGASLVQVVLDAEVPGCLEQCLGVAGLADAQQRVVEPVPQGLLGRGHLPERGARRRDLFGAQVEVRVQVDDPDAASIGDLACAQARVGPEGGFVAASQDDRQVACVQGQADGRAEALLAVLEVSVHNAGVAKVMNHGGRRGRRARRGQDPAGPRQGWPLSGRRQGR